MGVTYLTIIAYDKPGGNRKRGEIPVGGEYEHFTVDFNPSSFTVNNKIEFEQPKDKGKDGSEPQFTRIAPLEFSIEFTIDGTGVASKNLPPDNCSKFKDAKNNDYVKNRIKDLRRIIGCEINGTIHRPNYIAVLWGTFDVECVLTALNITYTLFDEQGTPLRAKVNCSFLERFPPEKSDRKNQFESPDLTKQIVIKEGDTLPLIAKSNYESSRYYLQIAKANKLRNFRKIPPGMKLILPPMRDSNE